jgi:hypothetical protein
MISFAHIINPVQVNEASDLFIAQPITFESMRIAREFSQGTEDVNLYTIKYHDEESIPLPQGFISAPDLTRSIADIKSFKQKRKLPLIRDILDTLHELSPADYYIYTNVDIALQPYFYRSLFKIIEQGYDAFVINRRTISGRYTNMKQIPLMYAEIGEPHPGYDCFVFRRDVYPQFKLGMICIGTAWIGRALLANMIACSSKFKEFRNEHLTFHIGDSLQWRQEKYLDYVQENLNEYLTIFSQLETEHGKFEPVLRSYLLDTGDKRKIPDFDKFYSEKGK